MITRDKLLSIYGAYALKTIEEESLPATLTDPNSREILTQIGVPRGLSEVISIRARKVKPIAEEYHHLASHRSLPGEELLIGYALDDLLTLNGSTGKVGTISAKEGGQIKLLNSSLSAFIESVSTVESGFLLDSSAMSAPNPEARLTLVAEQLDQIDPAVPTNDSDWGRILRVLFDVTPQK